MHERHRCDRGTVYRQSQERQRDGCDRRHLSLRTLGFHFHDGIGNGRLARGSCGSDRAGAVGVGGGYGGRSRRSSLGVAASVERVAPFWVASDDDEPYYCGHL